MARRTGSALNRVGFLRYAGELRAVLWRKGSASEASDCVEVTSWNSAVLVQDSKNGDGGPVLALSGGAWTTLVADIRDGRLR